MNKPILSMDMMSVMLRVLAVTVAGTLARLLLTKSIAQYNAKNRNNWKENKNLPMKTYHSDLNPEASWEDALVFNIVPTSEERMLIAEAIDSLEGDLWHEAGEQDWLDGRKLERIETMRLKWKLPTSKQLTQVEQPYEPY